MQALPPVRLGLALIAAMIAAAPSISSAQPGPNDPEPIVEPLPGEPMIEPLDERGEPIAAPEHEAAIDAVPGEVPEPPSEVHPDLDEERRDDPIAGATEPAVGTDVDIDAAGSSTPPAGDPAAGAAMTEKEYAAALRDVVRQMRGKVEQSILAKVEAKQTARMDNIAWVLSLVALGGLLMLLAPLILRSKYPGRAGVLWKYSAISAMMFFVAVNLFAAVLMTMRAAQDAAGEYTNPQVQVVRATFDLFEAKAEDFAMVGPELIEPTLLSLTAETDKPILSIMLDNVGSLRADVGVFAGVGSFFGKLDWAFGLLPIILVLLAVLLFAQAARPTLEQIIRLPARAAAAEDTRGLGKSVLTSTLRSVWQELKATGGLLVALVALSALAGICLGLVLQPAIEIFMSYLALSLVYVQVTEAASSFWILFSLVSTIIFLVLNLAVLVAATALFLGKTQKILQLRFRNGVALGTHKRFWLWGLASLALLFALPVVYIKLAEPALGWVVVELFSETNWALNLGLGPALFLASFGLIFWAARGFKAVKYLAGYKPQTAGAPAWTAPVELDDNIAPAHAGNLASWQTAQAAFQRPPTANADLSGSDLPTAWEPAQNGMGPQAYPQLRSGAYRPAPVQPEISDVEEPTSPALPLPVPEPLAARPPVPRTSPRPPMTPLPRPRAAAPRAGTVPPPPPKRPARLGTAPPPPPRSAAPRPLARARTAPPPPPRAGAVPPPMPRAAHGAPPLPDVNPAIPPVPRLRPPTARPPASPPLPRAPRAARSARRAPLPPPSRKPVVTSSPPASLALPLPPSSEPTPAPAANPHHKRVARGTGSPPALPSQLNSSPPPLPIAPTDPGLKPRSPYDKR